MACCDRCGKRTRDKDITLEHNGRQPLRLCPMCRAEHELLESPTLLVSEVIRPTSFWDKLRRFFG